MGACKRGRRAAGPAAEPPMRAKPAYPTERRVACGPVPRAVLHNGGKQLEQGAKHAGAAQLAA